MAEDRVQRRLAAILAADVVGYSRLMGQNEVGTLAALNAHLTELIEPRVVEYRGRIVKTTGDGLLAEFASVVDAVQCAIDIQQEITACNAEVAPDGRLEYRIGVNLGDVISQDDDIFGDGVNVAARLETLADPGGICISRAARDQVRDKLSVALDDLGEHEVKNIARPVRVFRVITDGESAPRRHRTKTQSRKRLFAVLGSVASIVLVAVVLMVLQPWQDGAGRRSENRAQDGLPDRPSIVVLPFENLSGDAEQEYFADGITNDLITDLSKVSGLFVIARNSSFNFKSKAVNIQDVANTLGVRYVLEGSVRRAGGRVRINAQLVDATSGQHLWAERFDRDLVDIFALQDSVTREIVAALAIQLSETERSQIARMPTENLDAYDQYLRAERAAYRFDRTNLVDALALYEKAIALDPNFAAAYAGYARAAVEAWRRDWMEVLPGPVARERAYAAVSRALTIDPYNATAYSVLAALQVVDGKHGDALIAARKAVALDPNSAEASANLALVLSYSGEVKAAAAELDRALRLDPSPPPYLFYISGWIRFTARDYENALDRFQRAKSTMQTSNLLTEAQAMVYARLGRLDEARATAEEIIARMPWANLSYYRVLYAYQRPIDALEHAIDSLRLAGIPEWPFGFTARRDERLDGTAIKHQLIGRTWTGRDANGTPFMRQISRDGSVAFRDRSYFLTGEVWVEGDKLCQRFQAVLAGRPYCGYVYRNPRGDPQSDNTHVFVDVFNVQYFSPK